MEGSAIWVLFISLVLLLRTTNAAEEAEKQALLLFYQRLSNGSRPNDPNFGWNSTSDPCNDRWIGVKCDPRWRSIRTVALDSRDLRGMLDANTICSLKSLAVLSIQNNSIHGQIPTELAKCTTLTHLFLGNNKFSGSLPASFPLLNNLKRLDLSNNYFSGQLPDLPRIAGLTTFLSQNNQLHGGIPEFDFINFQEFNVSFNNFTGPIPDVPDRFGVSSFTGNPGLCGPPLPNACPPSAI